MVAQIKQWITRYVHIIFSNYSALAPKKTL